MDHPPGHAPATAPEQALHSNCNHPMTMHDAVTHPTLAPGLAHSRFLARLFQRDPQLADRTAQQLDTPFDIAQMQALLATPADDEAAFKRQLRQLRQAVMARLIARELAGLSDLDEALATVSALADLTVRKALDWAVHHEMRHGRPIGAESGREQALIVVGMGKLGGSELNVSSDIDLIFVYDEAGETDGERRIGNQEYFTLIGKKLIHLLADPTEDGFAFRVDMRLRPFGDAGALVSSFAALENYLLTQGREWERYAWIKGRALTGDDQGLMQLITPFVYRKYLDYGAYASMRELHSQIRREVARRDMADNIKLGPGGIREIEFIGQVFQLIRGGRVKSLRERGTRSTLRELAALKLLPDDAVAELLTAYTFLRNLEHRLMYIDDAQTQMLPAGAEDRQRIAASMGFSDWAAFCEALERHRAAVTRHFEQVFVLPDGQDQNHPHAPLWRDAHNGESTAQGLARLGYADAAEIQRRLALFRGSSRYQQLSERSQRRLDAVLPPLIEVAAGHPNPDATLIRILDLLEHIGRRESYLALLAEHPQTLKRLASLYSASPWVSEYLTRHPILLDELLDSRLLYQEPDWHAAADALRRELAELDGDVEAKMDLLRHFQHTQVFRLVAQDIAGLLPLERLSDHLSDLADLILAAVMDEAWRDLARRHTDTPAFTAIGYGKLGGKELGYASDLDLVFVYDDAHPEAAETYARYAKKIVNWLSTPTAAGTLYDIDLRLRPNGSSGLLVSTLEAFEQYQCEAAWVWEHQALTRARFVAGDPQIGRSFEAVRCAVLRRARALPQLAAEVIAMRERMLETHPARAGDVKYCRGGIVDVEFIVQYLVLGYAHAHVDLTANRGNIALLGTAAAHGLIDPELAGSARDTYRALRRLQHTSRLSGDTLAPEALAPLASGLASVRALWQALLGEVI
ncbi:bifunctional [glutamate--ammonia ligase]-adenylyl-L-tyrosine phosphorylase/[glutamate--ammonia-ligase] adenylyltransferase [Chitiniphilus purpureus]|uniref:Bifunctional glutamine synthetase adenylyltransferase/adenylyl-removing enzyme n=1 Tax=Chitiniphilus purpureus TaxID=2981137 RepID=A0ABY6DSL5_9NEIS|nr:bifunctional [glutamate--ammonia ligase]-adenylyl-L-tyrosine phosphorylase/[glutamate--ammonia-ligase] adenylyltransferase [Chitiniphilus sp. CD1]UXY17332.1 bifunctional [glutamate--ammonia ligase]-adenylyl-L-tyrosine phosphorylase/[glutamate--ammonia-ligase] adenylyltransferase [Chitiniphilus sp. CD1]